MAGTKTFIPALPSTFRAWWIENVFPLEAAKLQGNTSGGGSILDQPSDTDTAELHRLRMFGPVWFWWAVPEDLRELWWAHDGR